MLHSEPLLQWSPSQVDVETGKSTSELAFKDVAYTVRKGGKNPLHVLRGVTGVCAPCKVTAIFGPTGAGKSTLLDVLARRKRLEWISGSVLVNGKPQTDAFSRMCGYVVQDDLLIGQMTVRENVLFSAQLRLPQDLYSAERCEQVVDAVLDELGLGKVRDALIGNELARGVSGGERKRTNIACELVFRPSVLFLDEPTTGLDAATAVQVVATVRHLARLGCTVVMSLHQPRFAIFRQLDAVLVVCDGHLAFHGAPDDLVPHLEAAGFACEPHNNPADFVLDVLSSGATPQLREGKSPAALLLSVYAESAVARAIALHVDVACRDAVNRPDVQLGVRFGVSRLRQFTVVCGRYWLGVKRLPVIVMAQMVTMVIFAGIVGGIYWQSGLDFKGLQNRTGAIFFMVMSMMFSNLGALEILIRERALFLHHKSAGYFSTGPYFLATVLCDLVPMRVAPMLLFGALAYPALGFQATWAHFAWFELILVVTAVASGALCYFVSAGVGVFAIANLVVSVVYVVQMLFGGLLVNLATLPDWLGWLPYLSLFKQGFEALSVNELHGLEFKLLPFVSIAGDKYLEEQGFALGDKPKCVAIMLAWAVAYLALAFVALDRLRKD